MSASSFHLIEDSVERIDALADKPQCSGVHCLATQHSSKSGGARNGWIDGGSSVIPLAGEADER